VNNGSGHWLDQDEQVVWRRLLATESRLRDRLDRELRFSHSVSLGDYDVLVHLSEAPDRCLRMSDLADRLLLSRSGLTRRLDGLVREGWVVRKACPDDRRGSLAQLTDEGFEVLKAAAATHVAGVRRYLVDALEPVGGMAALGRGLEPVERALEE
jgi:DNA-binding MarR family transcriptional regulator